MARARAPGLGPLSSKEATAGANFDLRALQLAIEFAGTDHLLAGSDYPHKIGSLAEMRESLSRLDVEEGARAAIAGLNAARLLGL